jgi:hypothetical protein
MKFVLLIYQGSTPLPGSDRWQALSEAEQKAIYADYAELNRTAGVAAGPPWRSGQPKSTGNRHILLVRAVIGGDGPRPRR